MLEKKNDNNYSSEEIEKKFNSLIERIQKPENYLPKRVRSYVRSDEWFMNDYAVVLTETSITFKKLDQNQKEEFSIKKENGKISFNNINLETFMTSKFELEKIKTYRIR